VSDQLALAISGIWLAAGFVIILARAEQRRICLAVLASLGGGAAFATAGSLATSAPNVIIAGCGLGAFAGALLAVRFQKLFVLLASSAISAFLATLGMLALTESRNNLPVALAAAAAGGIIALTRPDRAATFVIAFSGAQAIFHAIFVPADAYAVGWPEQVAERLVTAYLGGLLPFGVTTMLFVAYANYQQRLDDPGRVQPGLAPAIAALARSIATRLAAVIVIAAAISAAVWWSTDLVIARFEVTGLHALSWPVVSLTTAWFVSLLPRRDAGHGVGDGAKPGRLAWRHLALAAFGVTAMPVLTASLFRLFGATWDGLAQFYSAFVSGPPVTVACKWLYSAGVLPFLLSGAIRTRRPGTGSLATQTGWPGFRKAGRLQWRRRAARTPDPISND
jgi:hypothetical protein